MCCMNLVENTSGVGELLWRDRVFGPIHYSIRRFQGVGSSGLPIPGLHRIEGAVGLDTVPEPAGLVGADVQLRLEDGRTLRLTVADSAGRVFAEGHGPKGGCACC
jgi:hypothetical protein